MSQIFFYSYGKVKMTKNHFILHFHNIQVIARITMFPLWSRLTCACMYCPVSCIIGWCKSLVRFNFFWRLLWLGPLHLALRSANTVVWLKWIRKICDIVLLLVWTHTLFSAPIINYLMMISRLYWLADCSVIIFHSWQLADHSTAFTTAVGFSMDSFDDFLIVIVIIESESVLPEI